MDPEELEEIGTGGQVDIYELIHDYVYEGDDVE